MKEPPFSSDEDLARRVRAGDRQAFTLLVEKNLARFYRLAFRLLGDKHEAEEMIQNAFLKFWQNPKQWNPEFGAKFSTWFYRVVVNLCLDVTRKSQRHPQVALAEDAPSVKNSEEEFSLRERRQVVAHLVQGLPERQRAALSLCFYEGMSNQEAAEVMGIELKALQSLLIRGKENLKMQLKAKNLGGQL